MLSWNVTSTEGLRIGDTVYIKGTDSTRNCTVYIKTTVTAVLSSTRFTGTSHGYEDVLPVETIKSTINQSSDSVKIQAKHVEIDGTAIFNSISSDVNSAISTAVDNIEVGGRNLLLGTDDWSNWTHSNNVSVSDGIATYASQTSLAWNGIKRVHIPIADVTGDTLTLSFDYRSDDFSDASGDRYIYVNMYSSATIGGNRTKYRQLSKSSSVVSGSDYLFIPTTTWQRASLTFVFTGTSFFDAGSGDANYVGIEFYNHTLNHLQIRKAKLERGNIATDWTPAPEDQTTYVDNSVYQSSQPNLSPFFSYQPPTDTRYWVLATNQTTNVYDGWMIFDMSTASQSDRAIQIRPRRQEWVKPGERYTLLVELVDITSSGTIQWMPRANNAIDQIAFNGSTSTLPSSSFYVSGTAVPNAISDSTRTSLVTVAIIVKANATFSGKVRVSLYEGDYQGPYKPYVGNLLYGSASDAVEYIVGTQTAATGSWTGVTKDSSLYAGKTIAYKLPYAGSGNASLQLKDSAGNNVGGNIPVYSMTTRVTTHYPAQSVIQMTFDGTNWRTAGWYNTDTYNRTRWQNVILAAAAITNGYVICGTASGYRNVAAGVTFDLSYPLLYCATTKAAGETSDNNFLQINGIKITNNGTVTSAANYKTVYLVGTVSGNTFTVKASPFMTTVEPTSEDGFFYIPLGVFYNSTTNIYFNSTKDLYAYIDGKFRQVTPTEVVAEQHVYIQASQNAVSTEPPTAWVEYSAESTTATETDGTTTWSTPVWTTKRPTFSSEYPVVLVAMQRKRIDGTVTCTTPLIDDTTTVIDGGRLITGSVTANAIDATDLHVQAANIDGTLTASQIDTEGLEFSVSAITGLGDQLSNISGELSGKASSEDVSALSDTVSGMSETVEIALGDGGTVEKLRSDVDTIQAHISLGTIGEGSDMQPAITLDAEGGSSDGFKNVITNTSMSFMYGNETVAEVNKDELDITRTKVTESMQLGNFMWIPLSDGSLAFKWVEEDE